MRALTMEEVGWVAGGDKAGDTMIGAGQFMQNWAPVCAIVPKYGTKCSLLMSTVGTALVKQGQQRNQSTGGSGNGGGGSGEGGSPPVGNPGGYTDPPESGGGVKGVVCYADNTCQDAGQGHG